MKKRRKRVIKYPKEERMKVLADVANTGLTYASKKHGIPISTIASWIKRYPEEFEQVKQKVQEVFVEQAGEVIKAYLEHLKDPAVVKKTSARDSAIVIGTLRDKLSLAKGDPNNRMEIVGGGQAEGVLWAKLEKKDTAAESEE